MISYGPGVGEVGHESRTGQRLRVWLGNEAVSWQSSDQVFSDIDRV